MKTYENDDIVKKQLKSIFSGLAETLSRLTADHLEGGKYNSMVDALRKETESVLLHNKPSEELFAKLDHQYRVNPSSSLATKEATTGYNVSKKSDQCIIHDGLLITLLLEKRTHSKC